MIGSADWSITVHFNHCYYIIFEGGGEGGGGILMMMHDIRVFYYHFDLLTVDPVNSTFQLLNVKKTKRK